MRLVRQGRRWSQGMHGVYARQILQREVPERTPSSAQNRVQKTGRELRRESTEAYRVREDGSITPKDRLVKYCELKCVLDMGELNDGILPENIEMIDPCNGQIMTISSIETPYEYWGLPSQGTMGESKAFQKQIKDDCKFFLDMDFKWMVENADLVMPYFEEVATKGNACGRGVHYDHSEGVNWGKYIDDVKMAIALEGDDETYNTHLLESFDAVNLGSDRDSSVVQSPNPTESAAYRVRGNNSISAKDRLIEFCELSSIREDGSIEPERIVLSHPARRTSNRYWGISPQGGRSEADLSAWDFFMDFEAQWIRSHPELVRPHFDEVSAMGYGRSVEAATRVAMLRE